MSRSLFDQKYQIHKSGVYDDTVTPSETNWETTPVSAEDDFNALRSAISLHLDNQVGNWYDDLNTPTALDNGTQRGVNDLNTDLHAIERKRLLKRRAVVGADIPVPAAAAATGILTLAENVADTETVTIDSKVYTFQATLTDVDGHVLIGGSASDSLDNLIAAITLGAGSGTLYAASTTLHSTVTAAAGAGDTMDATAKSKGTAGNSIATTETLAGVGNQWGGATLSGGAGDVVILGTGELPGNTTAAVGAVTTLGTVVANGSSIFGAASLIEVAGGDTMTPKNLCLVVDSATGDAIVDATSRQIYALVQSEFTADGTTITDTTPNRVQLSFVVRTATYDDLELADPDYIGGKTIDYKPTERYSLEDIPEQAWLGDDFVDVGAAGTTRQNAYDNQGTTPVDLTTNATLDLEGAGLVWSVRDDLEAILFRIIEGSAGGTSEIEFGSDVDTFDNNAATNDFASELKVDTAGTEIDIGVTGGTVETTGSDDLRIVGAGELIFTDGNEDVTWSRDGILLSDTAQEWIDFETEFGEVSLLSAITAAANKLNRAKGVATVTGDIAADINVTGAGGSPNISAQLPDYSGVTSFVTDVDVYVNGALQWNGADAAANNDVYPGTSAANGDLMFEYPLRYRGGANPDVITMIVWD